MKGLIKGSVYKIRLNGRFIVGFMERQLLFEVTLRPLQDIVLEFHMSFQTFIS